MDDAVHALILGAGLAIAITGMKQDIDQKKQNNTTEIKAQYVQKQDSIINYQTQNQR